MEDAYFKQQRKHNHYDDDDDEEEEDNESSSSFSDDEEDDERSSSNSVGSSSTNPLFEMSSLISQLPFKRRLSNHYEGKSQSFTSLSNVKGLEDLIKPEISLKRKKLKPSKDYAWDLDKSLSPKKSSRAITKKSSVEKGSFSSLTKRQTILGKGASLSSLRRDPRASPVKSLYLLIEGVYNIL